MLHISLQEKPSTTVAFNFEKKKYIKKTLELIKQFKISYKCKMLAGQLKAI